MSGSAAGTDQPVAGTPIPGEELGTASTAHGAASIDYEAASIDYEAVAREKGWKPKEEFDGEEDLWVGAEEFVKRQPLIDKLKAQNKKVKELSKTVEALAKHYQINIEQAKKKAIDDLKSQRKEAIELGDHAQVDQIDQQIEEVKQIPPPVEPPSTLPAEIEQFVEDQKSWFHKDPTMTRFAIAFNESYLQEHPGDLQKSLDETLKAVKKAFPEKFTNPRRDNPSSVEGGGQPTGGGKSRYTLDRLTPEQKIVYNQLVVQHKQLKHDDYFKSLEEAGFLEK